MIRWLLTNENGAGAPFSPLRGARQLILYELPPAVGMIFVKFSFAKYFYDFPSLLKSKESWALTASRN